MKIMFEGEVRINGKIIKQVHIFKFLGTMVRDDCSNLTHVEIKKKNTTNSSFSLCKLGFLNNKLDQSLKTFLFRTYCKPIINFGMENCRLTASQRNELTELEAKILKRALGLDKRCYTEPVFAALRIIPFKWEYIMNKLSFFIRLTKYSLTKEFLLEEIKIKNYLSKANLIWEVAAILGLRPAEMVLEKMVVRRANKNNQNRTSSVA